MDVVPRLGSGGPRVGLENVLVVPWELVRDGEVKMSVGGLIESHRLL